MTDDRDASTTDIHRILELWVDSENKVRVLVFYRRNPGLMDTLEGLAKRFALPPEALEQEIRDHVNLGLLREERMGDKRIYVFDRQRFRELDNLVQTTLRMAGEGEGAS